MVQKGVFINKIVQLVAVSHGNYNFLLVAVSHGYQLKNAVGSQEPWQVLHFYQKTLNFIPPSGKKFHRT